MPWRKHESMPTLDLASHAAFDVTIRYKREKKNAAGIKLYKPSIFLSSTNFNYFKDSYATEIN